MAVTFVSPALSERAHPPLDPEVKITTHLMQVAAEVGLPTDPVSTVNLYVALKSKPMAILTGIAQSGKVALVRILAQALIGDDPLRCQMMAGHAWWASQTGNVALFTDMQARLNSDKVLSLIEEAGRPENARRIYLACLTRISPAELAGFFFELACQIQHGQIMQLPGFHLTKPIPYPRNFFLIGTMDAEHLDWYDAELLTKTTLIRWPVIKPGFAVGRPAPATPLDLDGEFLSSCIRDEGTARLKLLRILGNASSLGPVLQLADLLKTTDAPVPDSAIGAAVIYLANAWSKQGMGLFDQAMARNVAIATDLAIAQAMLPYVGPTIRSRPGSQETVKQALKSFPHSLVALEEMNR